MDLYSKLSDELRKVFKDLFEKDEKGAAKEKMNEVLSLAAKIGGPIEMEAELLYMDILRYIENPEDENNLSILKEHALRLEQETREI